MATPSQVKVALDEVAELIKEKREVLANAKDNAQSASDTLANVTTVYADVITTINGYGTTDAFEALAKAELAKLGAEFDALKVAADAIAATTI